MLRPYITKIRLPPSSGRRLSRCLSSGRLEESRKEDEHRRCKRSREYPEASPQLERQIRGARAQEALVNESRHLCTDQHADSVRHEHKKALRLAANRGRRFRVDVDLTGDEEEVVAHAVEQDADQDQREYRAGRAEREQGVAKHP